MSACGIKLGLLRSAAEWKEFSLSLKLTLLPIDLSRSAEAADARSAALDDFGVATVVRHLSHFERVARVDALRQSVLLHEVGHFIDFRAVVARVIVQRRERAPRLVGSALRLVRGLVPGLLCGALGNFRLQVL